MATSRGATPADPTLAATTDDNSRGGLFVRSNVANPVQGVDVAGTTIGNGTITLQLNGDEVGTFTTNQADPETINFVVDNAGGGMVEGQVTGGSYDAATQTLTLTRASGANPYIITGFAPEVTDTDIDTRADARIGLANIQNLNNVPDPVPATDGNRFLTWNAAADAIEYVPEPNATVLPTSFSSADDTVTFAAGTGADMGTVNLQARPRWTGNTNDVPAGATRESGQVEVANITLAADTGLVLVSNGSGDYTIRAAGTAPEAPANPAPEQSSALEDSPVEMFTLEAPGGGTFVANSGPGNTDPVRPQIGAPPGATAPTLTTMISTDRTTATVTVPAGGTDTPGMYPINIMTTTTSPDGITEESTQMTSIDRFIPFFQSRAVFPATITGSTDLSAAGIQESNAAWTGSFDAGTGSGPLYLAVLATSLASATRVDVGGFPLRVARPTPNTIMVTLADGMARTYNIFRLPSVATGTTISNFR